MSDVTARDLMGKIEGAFQADKAQGVDKTVQYELAGDDGGTWTARIADGKISVKEEPADEADVTIAMASADFVDMMTGKLNPTMAYMGGKLKLKGDMMLAQKLGQFFDLDALKA